LRHDEALNAAHVHRSGEINLDECEDRALFYDSNV
jgi:hypothetical protein